MRLGEHHGDNRVDTRGTLDNYRYISINIMNISPYNKINTYLGLLLLDYLTMEKLLVPM